MENNIEIEKKSRIRSQNYTALEKQHLLSIISKYKNIIENKKTDAVSITDKNNTWVKIAKEFNSGAPNLCNRSIESLKKYYENQKKVVRKKIGEEKKQIYLTGGGAVSKNKDDQTSDLLLSIMNDKTVYGLSNAYDSDMVVENAAGTSSTPLHQVECDEENQVVLAPENVELIYEIDEDLLMSEAVPVNRMNEQKPSEFGKHPTDWGNYKTSDLKKPLTPSLIGNNQENTTPAKRALNPSRRRPTRTVKTLTSSSLGEKYETLIDKKLELVECHKKEHELRMEILKLDILLKKKTIRRKYCIIKHWSDITIL